ncbi:nitrite reductase small subunit NirD [Methylocaldum szegediense]|uniref:Assimilatory nitrite reductase [NAD(P)H] small subunit n=1 Tax=Methylocaldum szegediense TaxID=73780 RepID=A0ABN8WXK2_9GAMM|nr:nitrite reductase small subunit NirD [Methylocaldum szegediense]CAI8746600.1 Assimilatory nitrite reductase [NAD(P)H] small subunit [Methylocaldum szegediense]
MTDWIEIGRIEDIPRQGSRVVATRNGNVAVFRTIDDEIFAVRDVCPHKGGPLSQGIVCGKRVACPLHNWVIDLASGAAAPPDEGRTTCFPVKVEGERLWLQLVESE